jgi:uncharacterized protein with predicted RNA binding PUA domain
MLKRARTIADFQFGRGAGAALFPEGTTFKLSSTGRLRYLYSGAERIATLRAKDSLFTLSILGAMRLHSHFPKPRLRVFASEEAVPFVARGGTLFARHVIDVDSEIRAGEEVLVVDERDRLVATGRAALSPLEMQQLRRGAAVMTRKGVSQGSSS